MIILFMIKNNKKITKYSIVKQHKSRWRFSSTTVDDK